jgi:hypothetical protein
MDGLYFIYIYIYMYIYICIENTVAREGEYNNPSFFRINKIILL